MAAGVHVGGVLAALGAAIVRVGREVPAVVQGVAQEHVCRYP